MEIVQVEPTRIAFVTVLVCPKCGAKSPWTGLGSYCFSAQCKGDTLLLPYGDIESIGAATSQSLGPAQGSSASSADGESCAVALPR